MNQVKNMKRNQPLPPKELEYRYDGGVDEFDADDYIASMSTTE